MISHVAWGWISLSFGHFCLLCAKLLMENGILSPRVPFSKLKDVKHVYPKRNLPWHISSLSFEEKNGLREKTNMCSTWKKRNDVSTTKYGR